jgi:tape measure domain-containing protein
MPNNANIKAIITAEDRGSGTLRKFGDNASGVGNKIASSFKIAALAGVAATAVVGAAVGKMVIGGGISRALNIEDAQAKLKGLGHSTQSVTKIMDSALASVKGTAYGLDAAATAAASAVAAGVAPGKELTRVLALTGDTATITGRSFGDAGAIINKVLASNRVSMEEVNQLQDAGLPILSMLGKQYKVNASEMREMVSRGEVDSKRFLTAIETNIGGAALKSGNTTRGAWANMQAAMSRVGAAIVKDIIPKVRDAFNGLTKWFDANSDKIVTAVGRITSWLAVNLPKAINWLVTIGWPALRNVIKTLWPVIQNIINGIQKLALWFAANLPKAIIVLKQAFNFLKPSMVALWNTIKTQLFPALKELWVNVIKPLVPVIGKILVVAVWVFINVLKVAIGIISKVIHFISAIARVIIPVIAAQVRFSTAVLKFLVAPIKTVIGWIKIVIDKFNKVTGAIRNALSGVNDAITAPFRKAFDWIMGAVRKVGDAVSALAGKAASLSPGNIGSKVLKFASGGLLGHASGTDYAAGGPVMVGEQGPEMVTLPRGSKVTPHNSLKDGGGNTTINITVPMMTGSSSERRKIARMLIKDIQDIAAMNGKTATDMLGSKYGLVT